MFSRRQPYIRQFLGRGILLGALILAPVIHAHGPEEHAPGTPPHEAASPPGHGQPRGETVQLQGELIDLVCYMQHPENGQGPEHAACARKCMKQGLPPGLLSEGKVYLLMGPGHESFGPTVAQHAGSQVKVEGHRVESGGMQVVVVSKLTPAAKGGAPATGHRTNR